MSTLISRLYSWATDKTNAVKITAARMDAENDQIITALNRKVLCASSAPDSPIAGQSWYDTTNKILKIYRNNEWVSMGGLHVAATAPSNPIEGDLWYETDTDLLKAYNGSAWVEFPISINSFTEKTTLVADDLFLIEDSEATNAKKKVKQSNISIAGSIVQVVNVQTGAVATGSTAMRNDDIIPQITEGNEYMTLAITPKSATNKLKIDVVVNYEDNDGGFTIIALFQDTTANALAATMVQSTAGYMDNWEFTHYMAAGTTSATTFKVRIGAVTSGTITFNGIGGARKLGGVVASSITITEIKA